MPDRKEIISALEYLIEEDCTDTQHNYVEEIEGAIALLREQEPVKPDGENCGECGYTLHRINWDGPDKELRHEWFRFCPSCGKVVKWDA